jgi:hypothetical protein
MIEGASSGEGKVESHLMIIRITIYPKVHKKKSSSGRKTKKNLAQSKKKMLLSPLSKIPTVMWMTPTMIEVFILKELRKDTELVLS